MLLSVALHKLLSSPWLKGSLSIARNTALCHLGCDWPFDLYRLRQDQCTIREFFHYNQRHGLSARQVTRKRVAQERNNKKTPPVRWRTFGIDFGNSVFYSNSRWPKRSRRAVAAMQKAASAGMIGLIWSPLISNAANPPKKRTPKTRRALLQKIFGEAMSRSLCLYTLR